MTEADKIIDISTSREDLKQNEQFGLDKEIKAKPDKWCKNVYLTNNQKIKTMTYYTFLNKLAFKNNNYFFLAFS